MALPRGNGSVAGFWNVECPYWPCSDDHRRDANCRCFQRWRELDRLFHHCVWSGFRFGNAGGHVSQLHSKSRTVESDILFNQAQQFDSYRGALRFASNGYAIADIRRVLLHELGHALGLDHPDTHGQHVAAVMNSIISNQETVSPDDRAGAQSLYGAPSVSQPAATSRLINISTRLKVGTNDDVLIGGFVISGTQSKRVLLRAIGPSLVASGIVGALSNPTLELHSSTGALIASNDNWQQGTQAAEIRSTSLPPSQPLESAIVATLSPGSYTAIVRGVNSTTGIAMIEGYELGATGARLVNISTRGRVGFGNAVLIGGFVIQGTSAKRVLMRAVGPSLATAGVRNVLANPFLELHNSAGALLNSNDNWNSNQFAAQISATGLAPSDTQESAIIATLQPGDLHRDCSRSEQHDWRGSG